MRWTIFTQYNFKLHPVIPNILNIIWYNIKDHRRVVNTSLKTRKISKRQIQLILAPGIQPMYRWYFENYSDYPLQAPSKVKYTDIIEVQCITS